MAQPKNLIGITTRICIMFLDSEICFMVEQPINHMGRFMWGSGNDFGIVRVHLIGNMGIKDQTGFWAVFAIDLGSVAAWTADRKSLPIRRGGGAVAPVRGERMPVMIIDDFSPHFGITLVAQIPIGVPGQAIFGHAGRE